VANGHPEQSVPSATLASASSLPPAAMQGHVMPSFSHTLIGLGPFANLGCQIVFTKMAVSVIHPEGHGILEGWQEQDGPRLWQFPLKTNKPSLPVTALTENYEKPGPRGSAANFFTPPLTSPIQCPAALSLPVPARLLTPTLTALPENYEEPGPRGSTANFFTPPLTSPIQCPDAIPLPVPARPLTPAPPAQTHPSQGCLAIDKAGQACSVTYMYGAAQALALAAQVSNTTFDPQSLDLPSMGALVGF
jgi:hypothetical protein